MCCYVLQEKKLKEKAKRKAENEKEEDSEDSEVGERTNHFYIDENHIDERW